jgi:hypothetical protein
MTVEKKQGIQATINTVLISLTTLFSGAAVTLLLTVFNNQADLKVEDTRLGTNQNNITQRLNSIEESNKEFTIKNATKEWVNDNFIRKP